jgi:transcriptional regulator GlxA family with amidase domain
MPGPPIPHRIGTRGLSGLGAAALGAPALLAALAALAACAAGPGEGGSDAGSPPPAAADARSQPAPAASAAAASWKRVDPPPAIPADRPLAAGFLIVDGVYNTELTAPYDVFHHTRFHASPGIEVFTVSPHGRPVRTFEGLEVAADHGFADAPPIDILVVPSAEGSMDRDLEDAALIDWVRAVGGRARYLVSLCDGAFVLARAGLLDGRAVTTFPGDYGRFAARFPDLDLRVNVSFVRDGSILTSAGGARSFDVAMHLVDLLYGEEVAAAVGRGMVIPWPPPPDESPPFVVELRPAERP